MGVKRGRVELFHDDQLVVALPDLKIIASTLGRFGVRPGPVDERPVVGHALTQGLANVDAVVSELLNGGARDIGCGIRPSVPGRVPAPAGTPHA
jgi:hypothetical protein